MAKKSAKTASPDKRTRILAAAGRMFMAEGYNAVSMEAIAEAAPVSKPTLYNHFDDKKALFAAVMQQRCQEVFHRFEQSLQGEKTVEEALTQMGELFLGVVLRADAIGIYRIAITEAQSFPELGKAFYANGPQKSRALLAEYFTRMDKKGELAIEDGELAANVFIGMLLGRFHMPLLLGQRAAPTAREVTETVRQVVDMFLNGVRR
jgi:TetR/AcrR family transcriptional repressor of mexJK operon